MREKEREGERKHERVREIATLKSHRESVCKRKRHVTREKESWAKCDREGLRKKGRRN